MPRHCSATGCCTRDTPEIRNRGISFHRLPKDNPRRAMWLENCRRKDMSGQGLWDPASKYVYFCSKHFEKSCFELVGTSGYHRLKEGAVPTIFELHAKLRQKSKLGNSKLAKRQQKQSCSPCLEEESSPLCMDISCFPAQELPSPGAAPTSGGPRSQPDLPGPASESLATLSDIPLEQSPAATGQEEASPSPALPDPVGDSSHPVSLSLYMLRLPPPAGAYIQNEHSYQVGSALLWKRRAEAALDALGKAQRQLQACRRREQRLRLRICELQRERRPHSAEAHRRLKEHLQVFELQLLNDLE
ncbi:THAP domain-containing protein 7 isoform X1 [Lacerta agilis]|uniref:THAP domain-containing protein 7 isoform X1 n=1 Tax=Lacerta agilis TaxID=80427 RepID=UPI001419C720|nr:THAP domain-containing protein 7 isoform X1 [Lacerta agilis]XP_033025684.1 THAP domain-containing protein 7 isoform X1 [Lacerta agilis]XP_033025685.1 THAP domain-containing protein 7 isoform X1 [Lacerta agilis]